MVLLFMSLLSVFGQQDINVGAEIWIEPGQTEQDIDGWFALAADNGMKSVRVFLMWNYIEQQKGKWDFRLYDAAFDAADRHGISIEATLCAIHGPAHLDRKFFGRPQFNELFHSEAVVKSAADYIRKCVTRYSSRKSLGSWWILNEPRRFDPASPLATSELRKWLRSKYGTIEELNASWLTAYKRFEEICYDPLWQNGSYFYWPVCSVDWYLFQRDYLTWNLNRIVSEVRKWDDSHPITMNPANVFESAHQYDLPAYQNLFDIYGASMHASWQLRFLPRDCYGYAVGGICDILRGTAPEGKFWISEMQGGNNIWSGRTAMCPDSLDLAQWIWTGIGSGAKKVILWALNYRRQGIEAGEWGLFGFKGEPTDRSGAVRELNELLLSHSGFFRNAKPVTSKVSLILSPESMRLLLHIDPFEGGAEKFDRNAHVYSLMTWYVALCEVGYIPEIRYLEDYEWDSDETGRVAILSDAIGIPDSCVDRMRNYVFNGNTVIAEGLTGFFDELEVNRLQGKNGFEELFGGRLLDLRMCDELNDINFEGYGLTLNAYKWLPVISPTTGKPVASDKYGCSAVLADYGQGRTLWIPACLAMGTDMLDTQHLSELALSVIPPASEMQPFCFRNHSPGMLMRILENDGEFLTVITNSRNSASTAEIVSPEQYTPVTVYGNDSSFENGKISLDSRQTLVVKWIKR